MRTDQLPFQGWRLTFFQGVMFAVFVIFTLRMYQMQVVGYEDAQLAAEDNRHNELPIPSDRGVIFDRYDNVLAGNVPAYIVRVTPAELPANREEVLAIFNRLSALTGVPPTIAIAQAGNSNLRSIEDMVIEGEGFAPYRPIPIAQDVPAEVALRILEENYGLPGVDVQIAAVRQYPSGEATSHLIGYLGPIPPEQQLELIERGYDPAFDRIGYDGLERFLEDVLAGQRGSILSEVNVDGAEIRELSRTEPVAGQSLRLTIDLELQEAARQALINRIDFINAEQGYILTQRGVVIAINPSTGEILALVSYPSYDNSRFARNIDVDYYLDIIESQHQPLVNQTIGSAYPPGSTWKLITAAAALEENVIDPTTRLFDAGDILVPNIYAPLEPARYQRFVCWKRDGHGFVDMTDAIAQSCNVYFYQIGGGNPEVSEQTLRDGGVGIRDLFRYATALGIGTELGIELPGELAMFMPDPTWKRIMLGENWSTGDTYNASVGQGYVNVTPLQLIVAISALVNDGTVYRPALIREYLDAERNITRSFTPEVIRTANLEHTNPDGSLTLLPIEDMIIQGPSSLVCVCEENSEYYNSARCDPDNYRAAFDINPDSGIDDFREYTVFTAEHYTFNGSVCDPIGFDPDYTPAFISTETMDIVRNGMRQAVTVGTANSADLPYITVAGKTGTAEYCDDIARAFNLCVPGNWPSHAWFAAYAPVENPEILIIGFVYNGGEGSANALPVVVETLEAYVRLRNERGE